MWDAKMLSASIRKQKKKAMMAEPELVHTDAYPDMEPTDLWDMDKKAQIEETVDAPKKIDARDKMYDDDAQQEPMSKEPMASHVMPKDHHSMAYGGAVEHEEPMMPSPEMEREYVAGSPESNQEMARRFSNRPSVGAGEGQGPKLGDGEMSEEARRIKMRKMRLASYMDGLDI